MCKRNDLEEHFFIFLKHVSNDQYIYINISYIYIFFIISYIYIYIYINARDKTWINENENF